MNENLALGSLVTFAPFVSEIPFAGRKSTMRQVPNGTTGEGVVIHQWVVSALTGEGVILLPIEDARALVARRARVALGMA